LSWLLLPEMQMGWTRGLRAYQLPCAVWALGHWLDRPYAPWQSAHGDRMVGVYRSRIRKRKVCAHEVRRTGQAARPSPPHAPPGSRAPRHPLAWAGRVTPPGVVRGNGPPACGPGTSKGEATFCRPPSSNTGTRGLSIQEGCGAEPELWLRLRPRENSQRVTRRRQIRRWVRLKHGGKSATRENKAARSSPAWLTKQDKSLSIDKGDESQFVSSHEHRVITACSAVFASAS
jgi:hypothetical protein